MTRHEEERQTRQDAIERLKVWRDATTGPHTYNAVGIPAATDVIEMRMSKNNRIDGCGVIRKRSVYTFKRELSSLFNAAINQHFSFLRLD